MKAKETSYILTHANIIDVERGKIDSDFSLEVKDGIITQIGYNIDNNENLPVHNVAARYIIPGLINAHTHLFGNGVPKASESGKGKKQERLMAFAKTGLGLAYLRHEAKACARDELLGGCTTIRSVGDMRFADVYVRDLIRKGKFLGPRMLVTGPALTCPNGHGAGTIAIACTTKDEFERQLEINIAHHVDWIKITLTSGIMDAVDSQHPGDVRMSKEQVQWVVDYAHAHGLKVAAHVECSEGVGMCLATGVDTIEHSSDLDSGMILELKKKNNAIITTLSPAFPASMLSRDYSHYSAAQVETSRIVYERIRNGGKQALENHLLHGLGTDGACPFASQSGMWRELIYFHRLCGASNQDALKAATIQNAKILGIEKETGSLKPGKSADLLIVNINPLEDLDTLRAPVSVIIRGIRIDAPKPHRNAEMEKRLDDLFA
jgi:imidazolonepropionase-like amidohydrolase